MNKRKIYLDTSIISHLDASNTIEKQQETINLFQQIINNEYIVVISDIVFDELSKCPEPKLSVLLNYLSNIQYINASETLESKKLSKEYLKYQVLKAKSEDDLRHIALATVLKCDIIVSWNFKHFVNINTIDKVLAVNYLMKYSEIKILPPSMKLKGDDENE